MPDPDMLHEQSQLACPSANSGSFECLLVGTDAFDAFDAFDDAFDSARCQAERRKMYPGTQPQINKMNAAAENDCSIRCPLPAWFGAL